MSWSILGSSSIGTTHRLRNIPCQDAYRFTLFGPAQEWLVVAVADGAGSASHSELGSQLICTELVDRIAKRPPETAITRQEINELFEAVRQRLLNEATNLGVKPRELAATVLLCVLGPTQSWFSQLGDGAIVIGDGTHYRTVFWPEPAEYANTTNFLTDVHFSENILFECTEEPVLELAVFSDGLQRLALDFAKRQPHANFFRPLFRGLQAVPEVAQLTEPFQQFLDSPNINARTDDDKTLILATRSP